MIIRNKSFRKKDAGVSAVIGVILMVAITVAIAATVYVYVTNSLYGPDAELSVQGTVTSVVESGTYNDSSVIYNITLGTSGNIYQMMFRTSDAIVPPTQVTLQFFYTEINYEGQTIFDVYKILSL
jgi:FlaG/FlaF family flagellin (archaellin)